MITAVLQQSDQPIVETAHLQNRDERFTHPDTVPSQLGKERLDLLRLRREMPSLQDIVLIITQRNRDLMRMLVDS